MPGRPEFSQPGTKGGGETVAVQNRPKVKLEDLSQTDEVAAGTTDDVILHAPAGSVYNVRNLQLSVGDNTDATSGEHYFTVRPMDTMYAINGTSSYSTPIKFDYGGWATASINERPSSAGAQHAAMENLVVTENTGIMVRYYNGADAPQTSTRSIQLIVEEVSY